ncbi:C40 family peptidase [Pontibacter sp. Tf4]|uniref:C40 family peptidase n=1 Tax=Pontibacter sp. Tf4 TaxID=2761620 RepID=UPI0016247F18|nr:C40 family peptidase [Pontibacter sp. Tf4]MBB6610062.1 C40 family peptidase [Pontibacter sp. Tf4]
MKRNLILFISPVLVLVVLLATGYKLYTPNVAHPTTNVIAVAEKSEKVQHADDKWVAIPAKGQPGNYSTAEAAEILQYANSLIGSPYQYAGITPAGFDCSGFVTHVFDRFAMDIPHSSSLQASEGIAVAKDEAAPGDLVIFTGTDETDRTPGHVGIVISEPGDTISFVHASSNGGVKISKVQGTRYDIRFLEVRRVL